MGIEVKRVKMDKVAFAPNKSKSKSTHERESLASVTYCSINYSFESCSGYLRYNGLLSIAKHTMVLLPDLITIFLNGKFELVCLL